MTKYATYTKYKPYIDVVMDDLGLTDKVRLEWVFGTWQKMDGDAILYIPESDDNKRFGIVRIDKCNSHIRTLETIMHELKHIQQYNTNRLKPAKYELYTTNRKTQKYAWFIEWLDVKYKFQGVSRNAQKRDKYFNQPWEKEAYAYQDEHKRLFSGGKLPPVKQYIGIVGKVTFYKTKG